MTRVGVLITMVLAMLGIGLPATFHPAPWLIWNSSASTAIGLYAVHPAGKLHVGDLVVAAPPEPLAAFLAQHRYLPKGVPLLKHVSALQGQTVCRTNRAITIDGFVAGLALEHDRRGRPLPMWRGCHVVVAGEVFLMNRRPDSFDSRYFGPLPIKSIVGRAQPLWIEAEN